MKKIIIAITGASGSVYGVEAVRQLKALGAEVHLVISRSAELTLEVESGLTPEEVRCSADFSYEPENIGAAIASGSFEMDGMIVAPCSIKTLSAVANSYGDNLISRAADVTLKEGRPLLLAVRETPLHKGHIRLMDLACDSGAVIFPPVPSFYGNIDSIQDMIRSSVGRMLSRIGIKNTEYQQWEG